MENISLFDCHCDTALEIMRNGSSLYENSLHTDLSRGGKYEKYCQVYAIFAHDDFEENYRRSLTYLKGQLELHKDKVSLCRDTKDIAKAAMEGKCAAVISAEGAELLGCNIDRIEGAKAEGISSINITWNYENALSGTNAEGTDKGLTEKGKAFVKKCFETKIAVDVSHISDPGFWDIAEMGHPFYASHSNSRAVCGHKRNLTDDQFKAIVDCGGIAGMNMYSEFVGENAKISDVIKHIDRFLKLGGEKNIAIGADFDGCDSLPEGIAGVQDMYKIYDELIRLGYGKELADDIFYNNAYRFYEKILG